MKEMIKVKVEIITPRSIKRHNIFQYLLLLNFFLKDLLKMQLTYDIILVSGVKHSYSTFTYLKN